MPESPPDFEAQLAALRQQYVDALAERIDEIEAGWRDLQGAGFNTSACQTLFRTVHSLAGSAPSFGHRAIGDAARTLEGVLDGLREQSQPPTDAHGTQVASLLVELRRLASEARA